jgi:hypothetical protein
MTDPQTGRPAPEWIPLLSEQELRVLARIDRQSAFEKWEIDKHCCGTDALPCCDWCMDGESVREWLER